MVVDPQVRGQRDTAAVEPALVGVWVRDEGYQVTEFLFRSNGRYQLDTRSTNPDLDYLLSEQGRYHTDGARLTLTPYEYFGDPASKFWDFSVDGESLSLMAVEYE